MSDPVATTGPGWAISAQADGDVLAARARGGGIELVLLSGPLSHATGQVEGWLTELIGVAVETSRSDTSPRPISTLLHHALTGLLFSHSELWHQSPDQPPCSLAFICLPQFVGFGWVGTAEVRVSVDGRGVDVPWTRVRDPGGRDARAFQLESSRRVRVELIWNPGRPGGKPRAARVVAEWPGAGGVVAEDAAPARATDAPRAPLRRGAHVDEEPAWRLPGWVNRSAPWEGASIGSDESQNPFTAKPNAPAKPPSLKVETTAQRAAELNPERQEEPPPPPVGPSLGDMLQLGTPPPELREVPSELPSSSPRASTRPTVPVPPLVPPPAAAVAPPPAVSAPRAPEPEPAETRNPFMGPVFEKVATHASAPPEEAAVAPPARPPAPPPSPQQSRDAAFGVDPFAKEQRVSIPDPIPAPAPRVVEPAPAPRVVESAPPPPPPVSIQPARAPAPSPAPAVAPAEIVMPEWMSGTAEGAVAAAREPEPAPAMEVPPATEAAPAAPAAPPRAAAAAVAGTATPVAGATPGAGVSATVARSRRPPVRRPEWPAPAKEMPERRSVPRLYIGIGIFALVLFAVGWVLGGLPGLRQRDETRISALSRALESVGIGPGHFVAVIDSRPRGAWIALDGRDVGRRTPATVELRPGAHQVVLTLASLGSAAYNVRGARGDRVSVDGALWGSLSVTSMDNSLSVRVTLDGEPAGNAPVTLDSIAPGIHQVQFYSPGVGSWDQMVEVRVNQTAELIARPFASPGTGLLEVRATLADDTGSSPLAGATVWLDGELRGVTPLRLELPRGPHSVRVTYHGEESMVQVIDLPGGNQRFATFELSASVDRPRFVSLPIPPRLPLDRPTLLSATLEGIAAPEVREMWLHVLTPEGAWRRYPMNVLKSPGGVVGAAVFPTALFDARGKAKCYFSVSISSGDEYFTEIQPVQSAAGPSTASSR